VIKRRDDRKEAGRLGERIAAAFLEDKGYLILHRNYRVRQGEIDIIARKGRLLSFIEVKARRSTGFGLPEEAVDTGKIKRIRDAAAVFLEDFQAGEDNDISFEVMSIALKSGMPEREVSSDNKKAGGRCYRFCRIDHIINAF